MELPHRVRHAHVLLGVAAFAACGGRARAPQPPQDAPTDAGSADAVAEAEPPRGKTIALVYTSNVGAEYERCGCPVHPLGGLGRRAAEVDRIRAESDGVVSVDAGDLFLPVDEPRGGARPPATSEVERRARLLAAAYARLGVTAFSPGERDLALGAPLLGRVLADAKVPVVSANLFDLRGRPLFAADRLVDVAGVKFGIFGVTAIAPNDPNRAAPDAKRLRAWGVEARDPVAAARAEVASLRARGARVVVALVHAGGAPDNRKLLAAVPGVDWAVLGHSALNLETPERAATPDGDGARMLEALSLGRNLGRLDLHVIGTGPFVDRGARAQLQAILADHRQQVVDYEQRLPTTRNQPTLNDYYAKRLAALRAAIAREMSELAATPARVTGNWFENRIVPLDTLVPDQPGVASLVAEYDRQSDRLAAAGKPVGVSVRVPGAPAPPAHVAPAAGAPTATYVGTAECVSCHGPAAAFWRATKHARALETLEEAHRARSPACVGCHVTGYLQPGGTDDVEVATTRLRDVGCESCHGPGSAHVAAPNAPGKIARAVAASVCLGCHTPDQTNAGFDDVAFRGAIVGPGHGAPRQ